MFGSLPPPHVIKGDLDSVREDVVTECRRLGTVVIRDPDQDSHDLHKCLAHAEEWQEGHKDGSADGAPPSLHVVVFGALGGRLDHEMANLNSLLTWSSRFGDLVFLTKSCLTRVLPEGKTVLEVAAPFEGPTCGLVPLGHPAREVTTSGLKWNLDGGALEFGGLVSSSNEVVADEVEVQTTSALVWTAIVKAKA